MHVTLRRKGLTLNAVWDGMAKPSSKLINYWLRTKPELPQANTAFKPSSVIGIFVPAVHSQRSITTSLMGGATLGLQMGAWGTYSVTTGFTSIVATQPDYRLSPWVVSDYSIVEQVDESVSVLAALNATLIFEDFGIGELPSTVSTSYATNNLRIKPDYSYDGVVNCEFSVLVLNALACAERVEQSEQSTDLILLPSDNVVLLDAPLPNHSLFAPSDPTANDALAVSPVNHMQSIITDLDENRDGYRVKAPRPTHFVLGSQTPTHDANTVRSKAPEIFVRGSGLGFATHSSTAMGDTLTKRDHKLTYEQTQDLYDSINAGGDLNDNTSGLYIRYREGYSSLNLHIYFNQMVEISGLSFYCSGSRYYRPSYMDMTDHLGYKGRMTCSAYASSSSVGEPRKTNYLLIRFAGIRRHRPWVRSIAPLINY